MRPPQPPVASKVFVQRDYSSGTKCQFQTKFPPELENRLDRQQFEESVRTLNNLYAEAEKLGSQSYLEGCLACLTAYTVFLCMETHYEKDGIREMMDRVFPSSLLLLVLGPPDCLARQFTSGIKDLCHFLKSQHKMLCFQVLKKIAKYVQEQNEKIYAPQGLLLTDPIERGLRVIEITIYEDRSVSSGR